MKGIEVAQGGQAVLSRRRVSCLAFAGGGTGGHLVPGLHALAWAYAQGQAPETVLWFTAGRPVEKRVLAGIDSRFPGVRVKLVPLPLEGRAGGAPSTFGLLRRSPRALGMARRVMRQEGVQVLLGLGGFTALPAVIAAKSLGIPVVLYEVNAVPGRATRRLGPFARNILHAWPASLPKGKASGGRHLCIGPVVGPEFVAPASAAAKQQAKRELHWDPSRPLLTVLGGSQGAGGINRFVAQHQAEWVRAGWQVLHQTGPGRLGEGSAVSNGYRPVDYVTQMHRTLATSDLLLARGGASTLAEVQAMAVPAWVVPYPHHADRHQWHNAKALGGQVRILEEEALNGEVAQELAQLAGSFGEQNSGLPSPIRLKTSVSPMCGSSALWDALASLCPTE